MNVSVVPSLGMHLPLVLPAAVSAVAQAHVVLVTLVASLASLYSEVVWGN